MRVDVRFCVLEAHIYLFQLFQKIKHDSCEIHFRKLPNFCKLRVNNPVARVYLGVCPRMEPARGLWVGDSPG